MGLACAGNAEWARPAALDNGLPLKVPPLTIVLAVTLPFTAAVPAFIVKPPVTVPLTASAPPFTVTPLARLPFTTSPPVLSAVPPVKVLAPASVSVPFPILARPPVPDITPEKIVLVLSLPVVRIAEPSVTLPAPATEPTIWLNPLRLSVAPDATLKALNSENALAIPACKVPMLTEVAPE